MPALAPSSPLEVLRWACDSTETIVGNIHRDQLAQPTPCRRWNVADLINHIVGATEFFGDLAERGASPDGDGPRSRPRLGQPIMTPMRLAHAS